MFDYMFPPDWSTLKKLIWLRATALANKIATFTGSIVRFITSKSRAVEDCLCTINPVKSGSGDPAPDNIRPISGFTGLTVTRTGKNLFNKNGVTAGYALDAQGSEFENANFGISDYIKVNTAVITVSGVTYSDAAWSLRVHAYDEKFAWIRQIKDLYVNSASVTDTVIHVPASASYIRLSIGIVNRQNLNTLMVEYGSAVSAYEPFGTTYPISWQSEAGTVYGGTLDVVSGVLTVTHKSADMGTFTWAIPSGSTKRFAGTAPDDMKEFNLSDRVAPIKSSYYVPKSYNYYAAETDTCICAYRSGLGQRVGVCDFSCDGYTAEQFKQAVSGAQLVYELATPVEISLTPTEIETLDGENVMWHDANGDISVSVKGGKPVS